MVGFKHFISKGLRRKEALPGYGEKSCLEGRGRGRGRRPRPVSDYGEVHLEHCENSPLNLKELVAGPGLMKACFVGGSYWLVEAAFGCLEGVMTTAIGYCILSDSEYRQEPDSDRTFAVLVTYDPQEVTYQTLLQTFWQVHDPTEKASQAGGGSSCRSAILYYTGTQRRTAQHSRVKHQIALKKRVVTKLMPASKFVYADAYYQKFVLQSRHLQLFQSLRIQSLRQLIESSEACWLNGYVTGMAGTHDRLYQLSLSQETRDQLRLLDFYLCQPHSKLDGAEPAEAPTFANHLQDPKE